MTRLEEALEYFRSPPSNVIELWEGRESHCLSTTPAVAELRNALTNEPLARQIVEAFLDELFSSLVLGSEFDHSEAVMAVLYALPAEFEDITEVIASSNAVEVGRLSRFARRLVRERRGIDPASWYDLDDERAQHRAAVNAILIIDQYLHASNLTAINMLLSQLEVPRLPIDVMIAVLNATYPVREQLETRASFVDRVEVAMTAALGRERASKLLASRR